MALIGTCSDEFLRIHDGPSNSSDIIANYCKDVLTYGSYFFSSGRNVFLEVKTGPGYNNRMKVDYYAVDFKSNYNQDC